MVHGPQQLNSVEWDGFGRIKWGRYNSWDQGTCREGDSVTLETGSATVGNGEHDTALVLSEVWDGLQGPDCDVRTATRWAQLLNRAGDYSNSSVVFFRLQDQLLPNDAE
ncbi:hypothetical protein F2Q69_00005918 [Brassica cretica]|uniref:Uncharacterized protein n=1 Tax=Brassica cretica TaxID=69181 RepID=A0A8S9P3E3_BRACR|nr:hypothetical protein F2Q69_00005918 [Brassica cretica]